jgi:CRISPR-associated protein Csd1
MILQALCGYYDRLAAEPDSGVAMPGWATEKISSRITLYEDGNKFRVTELTDVNGKKKEKLPMIVPKMLDARTSGKFTPHFLCDNISYILGDDEKNGKIKFKNCVDLHHEVLDGVDDIGAHAVLNFFDKYAYDKKSFEDSDIRKLKSGYIVFRLKGTSEYVHERPMVKLAWEQYYARTGSDSVISQCLVTGKPEPIARLHDGISGVSDKTAMLVSFNNPAFESYGKKQGENAPVSKKAEFQYTTALENLIKDPAHCINLGIIKDKKYIGDKIVFWAERDASVEESFLHMIFGGNREESTEIDEISARKIRALLSSIRNGKPSVPPDIDSSVTFHLLGVAFNDARLVVRFFYSSTFGNLLDIIGQHYRDIVIVDADRDSRLTTPYSILIETAVARKRENIPPTLEGALMRSVITGAAYPYSLYNAILTRTRADKNVNHTRAGVIKGFLNRSARLNNKKEMMNVALNLEETNQGYLLGRLFAVLEKAQKEAMEKPGQPLNATIVDKYLNSALATPQTVFPVLLPLYKKHIAKSDFSKGRAVQFERLVSAIMDTFDSMGFPQTLNAEDQGRFIVGYYHQNRALWTKNENTTITEVTENE